MEMRIDSNLLQTFQLNKNDAMDMVHKQGVRKFYDAAILDANETVYFARELEFVKKRSYDVLYPEYKAPFFVPISSDGDPGEDKATYEQYDRQGVAAVINNEATDYPNVEISKKQFSNNVKTLGNYVQWNLQDLQRWAYASRSGKVSSGRSYTQRKTDAGVKGIREKEEQIVAQGDSNAGLVGFYNNSNLTTVTVANDGTGQKRGWSLKDNDKIIRDFNLIVNRVQTETNSVHKANTVILSTDYYTLLNTNRISNTNVTVLSFLMDAHKDKNLKVFAYDRVNNGVASGSERVIAYQREPNILTQEIPQPLQILPPQQVATAFRVYLRERHGGVFLYYPKACARAVIDGNS